MAKTLEENAQSLLDLLEHAASDFNASDAALVFRSRDGKGRAVMLADSDRAQQLIEIHQHEWELAGIIIAAVVEHKLAITVLPAPTAKAWAGKFLQDFALAGMMGKTTIPAPANA